VSAYKTAAERRQWARAGLNDLAAQRLRVDAAQSLLDSASINLVDAEARLQSLQSKQVSSGLLEEAEIGLRLSKDDVSRFTADLEVARSAGK
jgi:hypothetical protein